MSNYWEYLVLNIVIHVITIYWEFFFFFVLLVYIVVKSFAKFKKKLILWLIIGGIFSTKYCD